jgi:hypothetical protein
VNRLAVNSREITQTIAAEPATNGAAGRTRRQFSSHLAGASRRHAFAIFETPDYFGGSSSLLLSHPFSLLLSFGAGFCDFLSGFFSSKLKNIR